MVAISAVTEFLFLRINRDVKSITDMLITRNLKGFETFNTCDFAFAHLRYI